MNEVKLPDQYDNYRRPIIEWEKPSGKNPVEPGASLPVRIQIEQMLQAGQRLNDFRVSQFDFDEGMEVPDDIEPDPTRSPEFDLADATYLARVASENLHEQAKAEMDAKPTETSVLQTEKPAGKAEVN